MDSLYPNQTTADFIVGGAFKAYATASRADVVVVVDSQEEVDLVPDSPRLIKMGLGGQDTVLTMLQRLKAARPEVETLWQEYSQGQNIHLGSGMAQDPRLGECAILDLLVRGELDTLFREIFTRVLEAANGSLDLLVVREFNSNAGGMGAGGAHEIGNRFCVYTAQRTSAKIRRRMMRLGGLTYAALSNRTIDNTAQVTQRQVAWMLDDPVSAWELRDLDLYELPLRSEAGVPIRDKRELRSLLAATLAQARYADAVNSGLNLREVNETAHSRFGGMLRGRVAWSQTLDDDLLLRAAASAYRQQLKHFRQHPDDADMDMIQDIQVELTPQDRALAEVETIMAVLNQPQGVRSEVVDDFVSASPQVFDNTVWVELPEAQSGALYDILQSVERPTSLAEFRTRRRRLLGLLTHLEHASETTDKDVRAQLRILNKQRQIMQHTIRRLRSFWSPLAIIAQTRSKFMRNLQVKFEAYARVHARHSEAEARLESLTAAMTQVAYTLEQYDQQWIRRIEEGLESVVGKWMVQLDTVVFGSLEVIYSELIDATLRAGYEMASGNKDKALAVLRPVLLGAISHVTLEGLAEMLNSTADPGAIVTAIEDQRFAYVSALWGGTSTYMQPRYRYVILPPVAAADLATLQRAAKERQFAPTLAAAESSVAGCCIVALAYYPINKREEVLPPIYTHTTNSVASQNGLVESAGTPA